MIKTIQFFRQIGISLLLLTFTSGLSIAVANQLPDFAKLAKENSNSVVNISTKKFVKQSRQQIPPQLKGLPEEWLRYFYNIIPPENQPDQPDESPDRGKPELHSLGSGFIYNDKGLIVTNHHVVDGADEIIVRLSDFRTFKAELIGTDPRTDLALLKVTAKNLPSVRLGNSDKAPVGSWVMAIGSPFGFDYSVTKGIISAKNRSLPNDSYVPFIQSDVAINPGNSGGPLFNLKGEVVGVNSQIYSRSGGFMGVSFSIPVNLVKFVINQLEKNGKVSRGYLGVQIQEVTSELSETFNMDIPHGALVANVFKDTPAEAGGIEVGDVITHFNNEKINRSYTLPHIVGITEVNKTVPVRILRNGQEEKIFVTIAELPENQQAAKPVTGSNTKEKQIERMGATVEPLPKPLQDKLQQGVLITEITRNSPADIAGLDPDDVILKIQRWDVESTEQVKSIMKKLPSPVRVRVLIYRKDRTLFTTMYLD